MKGQWTYVALTVLLASIASYSAFFLFLIFFFWIKKQKSITAVLIYFVLFVIIFCYTSFVQNKNVTTFQEGAIQVYGKIIESPTIDGNKMSFLMKAHDEKIKSYYYLNEKKELHKLKEWKAGTVCLFKGNLAEPIQHTVENGFNYKEYLKYQKIHWIFYVDSILECNYDPNIFEIMANFRSDIIQFIRGNYPAESSGFVQALIIGYREDIHEEDYKIYQQLGIIHLLAISGLHVGFIIASLYWLLLRFNLTKEQVIIILCIILPFFSFLTGAAPSVLRASLMAEIFLLARLFYKSILAIDCISISFIIFVLINPYEIYHIGFQLSYVVSYSLILSQRLINKRKHPIQKFTMVTIIAQLSSLPIILYYHYEFSLISIVANLFFIPLYVYFFLPLSYISFLSLFINESIAEVFITVLNFGFQYSLKLTHLFSYPSFLTVTVGQISIFTVCFFFFMFIYLCMYLENGVTIKQSIKIITCWLVVLVLFTAGTKFVQPGEVTFIDVGQGDAIFIREPGIGRAYLIDTGGVIKIQKEEWKQQKNPFSLGEDVLIPFLKSKGITELDGLFLTHGDIDHIGEAKTLLENIKVRHLFIPKYFGNGSVEKEVLKTAKLKNIPIHELKEGDQIQLAYTFYVLSPIKEKESKNDNSLVLFAEIGGKRWLFTGDLEKEGELLMLKNYPKLDIDVLKVGHHGSLTSTSDELLSHINPKIAVISVGRNNRYQHPHQEVLTRLEQKKVTIFRTDQMGSIQYVFRHSYGTFYLYPPYDIATK